MDNFGDNFDNNFDDNFEIDIESNYKEIMSENEKEITNIKSKENIYNLEKINQIWLKLKKTIGEGISEEIIEQQKDDINYLKNFIFQYYQTKILSRQYYENFNRKIKNMRIDYKKYIIKKDSQKLLSDFYEPITNLLFLLQNNYPESFKV